MNAVDMWEELKKGDIVKIPLCHSDLVQAKVRPALVLYHDLKNTQLTVAYITSKTDNLEPTDILITFGSPTCNATGLPKTSALRVHWLAVVKRIHVIGKYGEADDVFHRQVNKVLPECLAI
ncbi:MAG: type II toxin-antitoxin system PemK/MazF family toxin [Methanosarcinales archaeon]|nr:type II toxin-antitoxin system PemK/MazF family toxin [Methanosarcinales archaeon]